MSKLGFIGLGIMGVPMAGHLIAAGHEVFLNTIGQVPRSLVDAGGKACPSAAGLPGRPISSSSRCARP